MRLYGIDLPARIVTGVAFAVQMITLIYAASGLPPEHVQEAHMMYFIVNTFMIFYLCWRSLLIYNLIVVVHHLVLTLCLTLFDMVSTLRLATVLFTWSFTR